MKLEKGNYIYKLRYGTAESRDKIDCIVDCLAIGQTGQTYQVEYGEDLDIKPGLRSIKFFGVSYVRGTLYNISRFEKDITIRDVRNFDFSKLTLTQLQEAKDFLQKFQK